MDGNVDVIKEVLDQFRDVRKTMQEHEMSDIFDVVEVYAEQLEDELTKLLDDLDEYQDE